jgi:hypothetical protein
LSKHFAALELHGRARHIHAARRDWPAARSEYERAVQALQSIPVSSETALSN